MFVEGDPTKIMQSHLRARGDRIITLQLFVTIGEAQMGTGISWKPIHRKNSSVSVPESLDLLAWRRSVRRGTPCRLTDAL